MNNRIRSSIVAALAVLLLSSSAFAQRPLDVKGLPDDYPLTVSASASRTELAIDVHLQPEWHLYGRDTGGGAPVAVELADGSAFAPRGPLAVPVDASGRITGHARITLPLERVGKDDHLRARFRFMVCDALMCLPPAELEITGRAGALEVLLVVAEMGERSDRQKAFLAGRGFQVSVTSYEDIEQKQCDAHDVVIADSPLFGKTRGARNHALQFPRTVSPVVAVGFLGTEIIEKHGLAMTSGYI